MFCFALMCTLIASVNLSWNHNLSICKVPGAPVWRASHGKLILVGKVRVTFFFKKKMLKMWQKFVWGRGWGDKENLTVKKTRLKRGGGQGTQVLKTENSDDKQLRNFTFASVSLCTHKSWKLSRWCEFLQHVVNWGKKLCLKVRQIS